MLPASVSSTFPLTPAAMVRILISLDSCRRLVPLWIASSPMQG